MPLVWRDLRLSHTFIFLRLHVEQPDFTFRCGRFLYTIPCKPLVRNYDDKLVPLVSLDSDMLTRMTSDPGRGAVYRAKSRQMLSGPCHRGPQRSRRLDRLM